MPYQSVAEGNDVKGIRSLLAYVNDDGDKSNTNCGLAAAATVLHYKHLYSSLRLNELEASFPPDIFWGALGSSKALVLKILDSYACAYQEIQGKLALRAAIAACSPVIVMLQLSYKAAHWTIAQAYNDDHVCLTNYASDEGRRYMSWQTFDDDWQGMYASAIGMKNTAIRVVGVNDRVRLPRGIA